MSKVNRRKEIKQKEDLLAKFRLLSSQTNSKVASWLSPSGVQDQTDANASSKRNDSFLNLPIIQNGASLSAQFQTGHTNTIKDLMGSKDINNFKKKKEATGRQSDSKALNSLINKMRDSKRSKIKQGPTLNNKIQKVDGRSNNNNDNNTNNKLDNDNDENEDESLLKNRTVKKGSGLSFSSKKKKGSSRTF